MRVQHRVVPALLTLALVVAAGPAFACPTAGGSAMPCCERGGRCDAGMRASGCCAMAPAPAAPERIPGQEAPVAGWSMLPRPHPQAIGMASWQPPSLAVTAHLDRLWYPPAHDDSPPLFLRNASILL